MENRLLTADEVADYLRVDRNTIYIWCRKGILPAIKIGKEWRIREADLTAFVTPHHESPVRPASFERMFGSELEDSEHLLVVAPRQEDVWKVEAEFFKLAVKRGHLLLKGCWWQHPDDVRHEYTRAGLPVEDLEARGDLVVYNFWDAYKKGGAQAVVNLWYRRGQDGYFWGSGSYLTGEWETQLPQLVDFEDGLHRTLALTRGVAICPCVPNLDTTEAITTLFKLTLHHTGTVMMLDDDQLALLRPAPLQ